MKRTIAILVAIIATLGFSEKAFSQTSGLTFQVSNKQSETLGTVTVSTTSGDYYVSAPGNSTDTVTISDTATSVTIYGQTVPQGQNADITLPDQTVVAVIWTSPCSIIVLDPDEID
jgi:hypothetical protein